MGVVVLAVGTSIPDAMGSMIVARQGEADMAIANAVGSNVFDILLGLGLPWFLASVAINSGNPNIVDTAGIGMGKPHPCGTLFLGVGFGTDDPSWFLWLSLFLSLWQLQALPS